MKSMMILSALFLNASAHAYDGASGGYVAHLLGSRKTAPCLAKLHRLAGEYEVSANSFTPIESKAGNGGETLTEIHYSIGAGDMRLGSAKITVIEGSNGEAAESRHDVVVGCAFEGSLR